ncbi:MAG TPA: PQ-loop domain-containing transporter [Azospirillaceae bacterium]|nr:PQ-loop domain-containing transporter [Azospirillaceae bacterium]
MAALPAYTAEIIGFAATVVSVVSLLPQAVKSLRSRSTHDLSTGTWSLFCAGELLWCGYGALSGSGWTVAATIMTAATAAFILALKLRYGDDAHRFVPITEELREVVRESETASNRMLLAAETIEGIIGELKPLARDPEAAARLERLHEQTLAIFEACNFQDICGQRVTRVVKTFQYIEARNPRIREVWEKTQTRMRGARGTEAVGPALAGERGIDQTEIDRLFD